MRGKGACLFDIFNQTWKKILRILDKYLYFWSSNNEKDFKCLMERIKDIKYF